MQDSNTPALQRSAALPWFNDPRKKTIAWRGTDTHDEDLATILPSIGELQSEPALRDWKWHFSGGMPWEVHEVIPKERLEISPFCGPVFFVPLLTLFAPYILLAPLKRHAFNLCKSNLAWLEATCAGAVVLAPDFEEWKRPGIVNYHDGGQFKARLLEIVRAWERGSVGALHPNVAISRKYIEENLGLAYLNEQRWEVLHALSQLSR